MSWANPFNIFGSGGQSGTKAVYYPQAAEEARGFIPSAGNYGGFVPDTTGATWSVTQRAGIPAWVLIVGVILIFYFFRRFYRA